MRAVLVALASFALLGCQASAEPGASCAAASDCTSPLVCRFGRCRVECARNLDCPPGARCLLDDAHRGSCSLDADERCESGGHTCPTGLICVGDQCANSCTSDGDCPADSVCRPAETTHVSFCFASDRQDGGPIPVDASIDAPLDVPPDTRAQAPVDAARPDGGGCTGASCGQALALCLGRDYACAIRDDHRVLCWGQTLFADGPDIDTETLHDCGPGASVDCTASAVSALDEAGGDLFADDIACADHATCVRTASSDVYCWGVNGADQVGVDRAAHISVYRAVRLTDPLLAGVTTRIVASSNDFCAETQTGDIVCWGSNQTGQFGSTVSGTSTTPRRVGPRGTAVADNISLWGISGTMAMRGDGFTLAPFASAPTATGGARDAACALVGGAVHCWGAETGCGTFGISAPNGTGMELVAANGPYTALWTGSTSPRVCAETATHAVDCWGSWLDIDTGSCTGPSATPTHVPALDGARAISLGGSHVCMIDAAGAVQCAGSNVYGQLGRYPATHTFDDTFHPVCISTDCVP